MRLNAITVGTLRMVVDLYAEVAWRGRNRDRPDFPGDDDDPVEVALGALEDESLREGDLASRRYTLKLGNPRYPFMKLVLQEHLVEGEFFFEVDTHDQMFHAEGEEAERFESLMQYNLRVKRDVERAWEDHNLPTALQIRGLVETWPVQRTARNGRCILVVDNDQAIAATLAILLQARGYEVELATDGREAVDSADAARHDLVLMDNEMPHLNGFEACRMLKARPETRDIPVLIATAGALTLHQLDAADGFMVKPFRLELLFSILEDMLGRL